ncbi:MAG: family 1 glycosylhydrolase [Anaerolineae bacterium]|nr:family 1 glycosylhydrolase [Anaerolineae bacterium]
MSVKATMLMTDGFLWGCATAAHQVEGDSVDDWSQWEEGVGRIYQNQRSGAACEWWRGRFLEDFDRAATMRNNAQRISIAWSRIEPKEGQFDEAAIGRYREMLVALHDRGMKPMVTLHHFTNPIWFAERGGWLNDESPAVFVRFVRRAVESLSDLCQLWCTINEPMVLAVQGYLFGYWTPGMKSMKAMAQVAANLLRAHAAAYHAIKSIQPNSQVGYAHHHMGIQPKAPAFWNRAAAQAADRLMNVAFNDALLTGVFKLPFTRPVTVASAKGALDWLGVQYYQERLVTFNPLKLGNSISTEKPKGVPVGPKDWGGIVPQNLFNVIERLYKRYGKPIYVTESGVPDPEDTLRRQWIVESVRAIWKALGFNYPVRGYFFWSLLDNFEWAEGYDPRYSFGLYQTNFETQQRTQRLSAVLYREICAQNGLSSEIVAQYVPELLPKLFPASEGAPNVRLKAR